MKINENTMKIIENLWKSMETIEHQWKSLKTSGGSRRHGRSLKMFYLFFSYLIDYNRFLYIV